MTHTRVPLNIFGVGFGLAGLATTWRVADGLGLVPGLISTVIVVLAAAAWALSLALYGRYVMTGGGSLVRDLQDMTVGPFASLAVIVPLLLVVDGLEPYAPQLARVLVDVLVVAVIVAGGLYTGFWMRGGTELDRLHPGYFLPTVAGGFIASAAAAEVGQVRLAQIMFGLGFVCWTIVGSMILGRLEHTGADHGHRGGTGRRRQPGTLLRLRRAGHHSHRPAGWIRTPDGDGPAPSAAALPRSVVLPRDMGFHLLLGGSGLGRSDLDRRRKSYGREGMELCPPSCHHGAGWQHLGSNHHRDGEPNPAPPGSRGRADPSSRLRCTSNGSPVPTICEIADERSNLRLPQTRPSSRRAALHPLTTGNRLR
jgi:hypothetical protein